MSNDSQIRILFLTAEPTDSVRLRLGRELEDIKERLRLANPQQIFVLEERRSARPKDISQAIHDFQPNIVHFSGHGRSNGELRFEDEFGNTQPVTPEALAALFKLVADHVNCVVLNACYSDIQAEAIVQHIPFVIGMKRAIGDEAAIAFAVGFYKALGANRTIEEAYEFGCVEIQLQGIPEESTPVLRKKQERCLRQADATPAMFYLERPAIEKRCYEEIKQPGSLIRIKAPENMGKTWLMNRIVAYARGNSYKTVTLSFKGLVGGIFSDEETFLRSLCVAVGDELELPNNLNQHWDDKLSCIFNCTMYFQKYLLTSSPVVLALNYLDLVFEQSAIANNFCNMLRDWHDKAIRGDKVSEIWQKLRLIIVHSTEVYASLNINSSPLANVGLVIELPEFNIEQVQRLLKLHHLDLTANQVKQLMDLLGGHPLLLRKACDYLTLNEIPLEKLLKVASTIEGPFTGHLLEHLSKIENNPDLKTAFRQVITAKKPVQLPPTIARSLHRLGLVKLEGNFVKPRCKLYRQFFCDRL
ncbi:AAA-like domain-containing protein [Tolypothrix sp. VBCCA 56010]|uniref:AAA-like domain-containing protein n=1 Tax=Tolypothrix sp. VBCCA 56010 TaxID=3137731 RepID=UPI003D7C3920